MWLTLVNTVSYYGLVVLRYLLKQKESLPLPNCMGSFHR